MIETDPTAPPVSRLDRVIERAAARERGARICVAAVRALGLGLVALAVLLALQLFLRIEGVALRLPISLPLASVPVAFVALVVGVAAALRPRPEEPIARAVDERLGLADLTATGLAVARDRVQAALAQRALDAAEAGLQGAEERLTAAFPLTPPPSAWRLVRYAAPAALLFGVALAGWELVMAPAELAGGDGPIDGAVLPPGRSPSQNDPLRPDGPGERPGGDGGEQETAPSVAKDPDRTEQPLPLPVPTPDAGDAESGVAARVLMSRSTYLSTEPVVAIVSGTPTAHLRRPALYDVVLTLDRETFSSGETLSIDPEQPQGASVAIGLHTLPSAEPLLKPGKHTLVATLAPRDDTPAARSRPAHFEILGADEGDDGGGDDPTDEPDAGGGEGPSQPPDPQPPPDHDPPGGGGEDAPKTAGGDDGPPRASPPPPRDIGFEHHAVVPLFDGDETVEKQGLRLVLEPGGGTPRRVSRRSLKDVLPEATWRAEEAVDRAAVREEDRELVRRYFRRLARLLE